MITVAAVGGAAMLAVAAHRGYRLARPARTACLGEARWEEGVHLGMALGMAAMFLAPVGRLEAAVLLIGALACLGWSAIRFARRPHLEAGGFAVSSVAMAVMVRAMLPAGEADPMAGMHHDHGAPPTTALTPLIWGSLTLTVAAAVILLSRGRVREAVMGGAMALMLGTMV